MTELLVIVAVVGLFVLLVYPRFSGPEKNSAHQATDISNIKQCGVAFFVYAEEHGGFYPTTNTTSTDLFNYLTNDGYITTPSIVAGSGATPLSSATCFTSDNVAWGCAEGLTTKDNPGYALLWSAGTAPSVTNGNLILDASNTYWGKKGKRFTAVYYLNGSASCPHFTPGSFISTNPLSGSSTNVYTHYLNP